MQELENVKVAKVAVAYDCRASFRTYVLVFDQVLYIPSMNHNLLCVDQLRDNRIIVNDIPLIRLDPEHRELDSHCIVCKNEGLRIMLKFDKPISYFETRSPTIQELSDDINNTHVTMTSSVPWEPYDDQSSVTEERLRQTIEEGSLSRNISSLRTNPYKSSCPISLADYFGNRVQATISGVKTDNRKYILKPDQLARRWRTSLECEKNYREDFPEGDKRLE